MYDKCFWVHANEGHREAGETVLEDRETNQKRHMSDRFEPLRGLGNARLCPTRKLKDVVSKPL